MKFIDLFCGVGGFRWALEALGHNCVFSSDIDPHAQETYAINFGEKPFGDITSIDPLDIPGHDVVCGGFPCQPFSISGKQLGFEDARGTLLYHILQIAERHQPKVLFLENVKNYRGHNDGRTLATTLKLLDRVGYHCHHSLLNASSYGVPQKRERLYFVCFRKDLGLSEFSFPEPTKEDVAVEDVLLPSSDPRLEKLFVRRADTFISTDLPVERDLRPCGSALSEREVKVSESIASRVMPSPCLPSAVASEPKPECISLTVILADFIPRNVDAS